MKVNEIFASIEGEGIRTGYPAVFIRLYGCNLNCNYCDTRYSCDEGEYKEMTVEEIVAAVTEFGIKRITLTGGEPLIHPETINLVDGLTKANFEVNIETNGSVDIYSYTLNPKVIVTMDYKAPSSGMEHKMLLNNCDLLRHQDVIKFVVGNEIDLEKMKNIIDFFDIKDNIFISPIFGRIDPKDIVKYLLEENLNNCRVQIQLHKIIWDPMMRGV